MVVTETVWPAKPRMFAVWSFMENVCQPWVKHKAPGEVRERRDLSVLVAKTEIRKVGEGPSLGPVGHALALILDWVLILGLALPSLLPRDTGPALPPLSTWTSAGI